MASLGRLYQVAIFCIRSRNPSNRLLTVGLGLCLFLANASAGATPAGQEGGRPTFNGVTAVFTLTRSRIRPDQKLKVRCVFRNRGEKKTTFPYLLPSVGARLYSNGEKLGDLCPTADNPAFSVALNPGESFTWIDELDITLCYNLAPGRYSIRFYYNLRLFDDAVYSEYMKKYGDPWAGEVPWDGRDHPFTVVK
jgi:hypothetical protein